MGLNYFTYNGKSSIDYEVWITGSGTFSAPEKEVESISIPGRNGNLHIDHGKYANKPITYPAFIAKDFRVNFDGLKSYLLSQSGYQRLEDTYNPEYYRKACFTSAIEPEMSQLNRVGQFNITFDCDPRRFLKNGSRTISVTSGATIKNPTRFKALPMIRVYGTGAITVNSVTITVNTANEYTDIDCENQEAYKGSTNCNGNITLNSGKFPDLQTGTNTITFTGFSAVEIIPNWWTL